MNSTEAAHHLRVVDSRTEKPYLIPIHDNYVHAKDLGAITISSPGDDGIPQKLTILDNGFENTACMESAITHIDGYRGTVHYRGMAIEDLFRDNDFEDVLHLLVWGNLPTASQKKATRASINSALVPPKNVINTIAAFPRDAETYPMVIAGLSAFIASDKAARDSRQSQKPTYRNDLNKADQAILRTIAYYATTIALIHCHKRNKPFTKPDPKGSLVGNLLLMMGILDPATGKGPDPELVACLEKLWILYADHEMTNSTAGMLHAASTLTDPTSAIMAGLVCGFGPLHGGAIDLAYKALGEIKDPKYVPGFIEVVKQKKMRLFGYGHRIYKTRDPRLALIEELIEKSKDKVADNPLLKVALAIDRVANQDEYFVSRNLKANADLLGCFFYSALGFERDMIIAIICLSRLPGGLAHWRETLEKPIKLWRPRQIYSGPKPADQTIQPRRQTTESLSSSDMKTEKEEVVHVQQTENVADRGRGARKQKHTKLPFKLRLYFWAKSCFSGA
ncbi:putative citrate synthase [Podospora australis]|uniref:Citrate synthase n=1 Tax=Podospora australis TaxID=1536484 RepID=A0AAN6WSW5_9PEZI|nr:putative citrate synthase [Podospora australis]